MKLSSPAFGSNEMIPQQYTCDGKNISPALKIEDIPKGAKSLALIVDDPDSAKGSWVHWLLYGIPVVNEIEEASSPGNQGRNDFGEDRYGGPCPGSGVHHYHFRLFALDVELKERDGLSRKELEGKVAQHILDRAELVGLYTRIK